MLTMFRKKEYLHDHLRTRIVALWLSFGLMVLPTIAQNFAGDMALSKVLIDDEDWMLVNDGFRFTDGACTDEDGSFYFSGRRGNQSAIYKLSPKDKLEVYIKGADGVSGLAFGPDGKLYGCRWGKNEVFVFKNDGTMKTLSQEAHANDLVITQQGELFYTAEKGVFFLDAFGKKSQVTDQIAGPNGICLSPDTGILNVSEYTGEHVWSFAIQPGSGAFHGDTYMTMRQPSDGSACKGDGMTIDTAGRFYVTSAIGLQMFDATGRISGVIAKPSSSGMSNVAFSGPERKHLYATCGNAIYKRRTKAQGVWHFTTK
jgi:gluconolactonase